MLLKRRIGEYFYPMETEILRFEFNYEKSIDINKNGLLKPGQQNEIWFHLRKKEKNLPTRGVPPFQ